MGLATTPYAESTLGRQEISPSLLSLPSQNLRRAFPLFSSLKEADFQLIGNSWSIREEAVERIITEYTRSIEQNETILAKNISDLEGELERLRGILESLPMPDESSRQAASDANTKLLEEKETSKNKEFKAGIDRRRAPFIAIIEEFKCQKKARNEAQTKIDTCTTHLKAKRSEKQTLIEGRQKVLQDLRTVLQDLRIKEPMQVDKPVPVTSREINAAISRGVNMVRLVLVSAVAIGVPAVLWQLLKKEEPKKSKNEQPALVTQDVSVPVIIPMTETQIAQVKKERESETNQKYQAAQKAANRQIEQQGGIASYRAALESEIRKSFGQLIETVVVEEKKNDLGEPSFYVRIVFQDGLELRDAITKTPENEAKNMAILMQQKPEEIVNNIELHQKIRQAWSQMCKDKADELFNIYFQTGEAREGKIRELFIQFFPGIIHIPSQMLKAQSVCIPNLRSEKDAPSNNEDDFGLQLIIQKNDNGLVLADASVAMMSKYFYKLTESAVDEIQTKIFERLDQLGPSSGQNILDTTKYIRETLEKKSFLGSQLIVEENRTNTATGIVTTTVLYHGPGNQTRRGVLRFFTLRTNNRELEYTFGHAMKIIHEEISTRKGDFSVLDNWGPATKEKETGPQRMQMCTKRILTLLSEYGVMKVGTTIEYLGSTTRHDGNEIIGMEGHFRFITNGVGRGTEFSLDFDLRRKK